MRIAVGSDHAGFAFKSAIAAILMEWGYEVEILGATSPEPFDYPVASDQVCESVLSHKSEYGILVCGSGIGVCMRANRYPGIRAAQCFTIEMAELARKHNHANVLCLGERTQTLDDAEKIVKAFLETPEDTAERHENRVELLDRSIPT